MIRYAGAPVFITPDQRGVPRCHVDIGAYEFAEPTVPAPTVVCSKDIKVFSDPGSSPALVGFGGSVKVVNRTVSLMDNRLERKVTPLFNLGQLTGSANVTLIVGPGIYEPYPFPDEPPPDLPVSLRAQVKVPLPAWVVTVVPKDNDNVLAKCRT